jgi:hypothetical protein
MKPTATPSQVTIAFVAAGMFYLGGVLEVVTGLLSHPIYTAFVAVGAAFLSLGCVWIAIAMQFKKKARG